MPDLVSPLDTDAIRSALQEGRQGYLSVRSLRGPHVTPELYAWSGDALWFAFATSTVKAKVLARDPAAAAVVTLSGRSVLLRGDVELVDPRRPDRIARHLRQLPQIAAALGRYTVRNAPDLMAFVGDLGRARLGWRPPPLRVLAAFRPTATLLLEGDEVNSGSGAWAGAQRGTVDPPIGGQPVVVGLPGPVATPGRWFDDEREVWVPPQVLALADLDEEVPVGVVVDEYVAPGPAAKQGTLLRGTARRAGPGRPGVLVVEPDRIVDWDGVETTSTAPA